MTISFTRISALNSLNDFNDPMVPRTSKRKATENDDVENTRAAKRPTRFSARLQGLRARLSLGTIQPNEPSATPEPSPVPSPSASAEEKEEPVQPDVSDSPSLGVSPFTPAEQEMLKSILELLKKEAEKYAAAKAASATTDKVASTNQVASIEDAAHNIKESSIYDTLRSYQSIDATEADALAKFFKAQATPAADDTTRVIRTDCSLRKSKANVVSDFLEARSAPAPAPSASVRDDEVITKFFSRIDVEEANTLAKFFKDQAAELEAEEESFRFMGILQGD